MAIYQGANKVKRIYQGANKVKRIYQGSNLVWSAANPVTYNVYYGLTYTEEREEGEDCLVPRTFTPSLSGWNFRGWRLDATTTPSFLTSYVMRENPVTLYGLYDQPVTVTYNGNGATAGGVSPQTLFRWYNYGNTANPTFTIAANGFSRPNYHFKNWSFNANGTDLSSQFPPGYTLQLAGSTNVYAIWEADPFAWIVNHRPASGMTVNTSRWGWCRNTGIAGSDVVHTTDDLGRFAREIKNNQPAYEYDAAGFQSSVSGVSSRGTKYMNVTFSIWAPGGDGNYNGPRRIYVLASGNQIYNYTPSVQVINGTLKVPLPAGDHQITIAMHGAVDAGSNSTPSGSFSNISFSNS